MRGQRRDGGRMRTTWAIIILCGLAAFGSGCTSQQVYASLQSMQRERCFDDPTPERERCLAAAETSYREYQQARVTP